MGGRNPGVKWAESLLEAEKERGRIPNDPSMVGTGRNSMKFCNIIFCNRKSKNGDRN